MAESISIARPYTKAAFATALAQGDLSTWSGFLNLAASVVIDADMKIALKNPALTKKKKAQLLIDVCNIKQVVSEQKQNFVRLVIEKNRLPLLSVVANLFEIMKANQENLLEVSITSAFALDNEQQDKLAQILTSKLSRYVTINSTTDASLIGGVIIHMGDMVIDGSIRGKLGKLTEALNA